jgi:hypothetical protein
MPAFAFPAVPAMYLFNHSFADLGRSYGFDCTRKRSRGNEISRRQDQPGHSSSKTEMSQLMHGMAPFDAAQRTDLLAGPTETPDFAFCSNSLATILDEISTARAAAF